MQCIDNPGLTKQEFYKSTNRKDLYSVYQVITTWTLYIRINKNAFYSNSKQVVFLLRRDMYFIQEH